MTHFPFDIPMIYGDEPFPAPESANEDGVLCMGGSLNRQRLLEAYSKGIFPWYSFRDWPVPVWYCPHNRFVIFPKEIHVSHSMRTLINSGRYKVSFNTNFAGVIIGCANTDGRYGMPGAWLGPDIADAYYRLHCTGHAASVEVWEGEELVGGLYGVLVGNSFIGESMFSQRPNASKMALIALARYMEQNGGGIIDCQLETPHLKSMGARFIPYCEYIEIISQSRPNPLTPQQISPSRNFA